MSNQEGSMDKKRLLTVVILVLTLAIGVSFIKKRKNDANVTNWSWSNNWGAPAEPVAPSQPNNEPSEDEPSPSPDPTTYAEAIKLSAQQGRPVFVIFSAKWCGWCQKMQTEVFPKIEDALFPFIVVEVDVDANPEISRKFGLTHVPAYVITNGKEEKVKAGEGFKSAPEMSKWLADKAQPKLLKRR